MREENKEDNVWWEKKKKMKKEDFEIIYEDLIENEKGREILVKDIIGGEDEEKKIKERVIKEYDWN